MRYIPTEVMSVIIGQRENSQNYSENTQQRTCKARCQGSADKITAHIFCKHSCRVQNIYHGEKALHVT